MFMLYFYLPEYARNNYMYKLYQKLKQEKYTMQDKYSVKQVNFVYALW